MKFEDVHEFPGNSDFYAVPNERLSKWQELVKGLRVYKAAGICSGGEVGLFTLLPIVRSSLTLVDHSYKSLYYAMVKYLALQKYGAEEAYRRITETVTKEQLSAFAAEFEQDMPEVVRTTWTRTTGRDSVYWDDGGYTKLPLGAGEPYALKGRAVAPYWQKQKPEELIRTCKKLNRVTFMHGDLGDLAAKGPFDLVYLSNALEHHGRNRNKPAITAIEGCLKPGGHVLLSGRRGYARFGDTTPPRAGGAPQHWEQLSEERLPDSDGNEIGWCYALYKIPEAVAA